MSATVAAAPSVAVLVTLEREREVALAAIESWGASQTYAGEIEVLALSDEEGEAPGPLDGARVVRRAGAARTTLFDLAARTSEAEILIFTEAHCLADRDCVGELVGLIAAGEFVGACSTTVGIADNAYARLDQRLFDEGFREACRPGEWRKVWPHGFAIRRDAFLEAGGFEDRYEYFGEQLLAARLHRRGQRLGYAEDAVVEHHFGTELREVLDHVESATRGRELWEAQATSEDGLESRLWPPPGGRGGLARRQAVPMALALLREGRRPGLAPYRPMRRGILRRHLPELLEPALLGRRGELALGRVRTGSALARCLLWRFDEARLERAYRDLWLRVVEQTRVRCRWPAPEHGLIAAPGRRSVASIPNALLGGFHEPADDREGCEPIRWGGPVCCVETALDPGAWEIGFELSPLRPAASVTGLAAHLGTRRLSAAEVSVEGDAIVLRPDRRRIGPDGRQEWVLTCAPVAVEQERTGHLLERGLPVRAIRIERRG